MTLKTINVQYFQVEYSDLERFIQHHYPACKEYSIVAVEEKGNDCEISFNVTKGALDEWEQKDMETFISTGEIDNWRTATILTDLCNKGLIEEGNYLVNISW